MLRSNYLLIATVGSVAMVAQTVWYRYASQILGQSALTVAAVVASALTGLALGNAWGGKFARRSAGWYASVMGIAVLLAQGSLTLLPNLEPWFENRQVAWTIIIASPLMVINFFAGAVFPRLLSVETRSSLVGRLSAWETLGGCAGAIFAGCFAMQTLGLMPTLVGAGLIAVIVGIIGNRTPVEIAPKDTLPNTSPSKVPLLIAAAVFVSGVASLGLEVVWHRLLILIVGTDSYSYAIVVTSYLAGFAVGAGVSEFWLRLRPEVDSSQRLQSVAVLQMAGAVASVLTLAGIIYLASGAGQGWAGERLLGYSLPLLKRFLLCAGLLLIPTMLQGACFPLVVDAVSGQNERLASPASKIYGLLAAGNVIGVLACGFFLVPRFGLQHSVLALAIISTLAALLYCHLKIRIVIPILIAVLILLCGHRCMQNQAIGLAINPEQTAQLYYREGPANTVAVLAEKANPNFRRLTVDGIIVGQSGRNAEEKQRVLAHLPTLLNHKTHPTKNVIVIGLGSGLLSAEVASFSGVETVTSLELSPAVIEANAYFEDLMPTPVDASRSPKAIKRIIQADGIHWLNKAAANQPNFDAIISDGKSRPGHVGNAAFFSTDYYQSALRALGPHGKFVQWYSLDGALRETKTVLRTFAEVFPHAKVAIAAPDSIYLIGSSSPIETRLADTEAYFNDRTSKSLRPYLWLTPDDLRSMGWVQLSPDHPLLATASINTLGRPILERFTFDVRAATLTQNKIENLNWLNTLLASDQSKLGLFSDDEVPVDGLRSAAQAMIDCFTIVVAREANWLDRAAKRLRPAINTLPKLSRGGLLGNSYLLAAEIAAGNNDRPEEISMLTRAGSLAPADIAMQNKIGRRLLKLDDPESALPHFLNTIRFDPGNVKANKGAAISLIKLQKIKSASAYYQIAIADPETRLDPEFAKYGSLLEDKNPPDETKNDNSVSPSEGSEQDILNSLKDLLKEPTPDQ